MHFNYHEFEPGTWEAQVAFFRYCEAKLKKLVSFYQGPVEPYRRNYYNFFQNNYEAPDYNNRPFLNQVLSDLYLEGRNTYLVLFCDFHQFRQALLFGNRLYSNYRYGYYRPALPRSSYVRQPHHKPKVIDEKTQAKIDWRKKKGFDKDHRRRQRSMYGRRKSVGKELSNSYHRAWESQCLAHEKYDELTNFKHKGIFDPWMWD